MHYGMDLISSLSKDGIVQLTTVTALPMVCCAVMGMIISPGNKTMPGA